MACSISGAIGVGIATTLFATGHGSGGALSYLVACWALASYGVLSLILEREESRGYAPAHQPLAISVSGVVSGVSEL